MTPLFSLLYTSARQHQIAEVIQRWERAAKLPLNNLQWCITTDGGQWRGAWDGTLDGIRDGHPPELRPEYIVDPVKNAPWNSVRGWNHAANLSTGSILILVADDFEPCDGWDDKIHKAAMAHSEPFGEWVMKVEDGSGKTDIVQPIISRKRFESQGFYYPHYESMYPDTELGNVASRDGVLIDARHILIKHNHPDFGLRSKDAVDEIQSSKDRYARDGQIYEWRKSMNFPKPFAGAPQSLDDYTVYMQVDRDDFFMLEVCQRMFDEGVRKFVFDVPMTTWSGRPVPQGEVEQIRHAASVLYKQGAIARVWRSTVPPAAKRIDSETLMRNTTISHIRANGDPFILIVDSDELWIPGALAKVHALAKEGVQSIAVPLISVAGVPPYPVRDCKDTAVVYIGRDNAMKYCRTTWIPDLMIWEPLVYHFSATRRTLELLIQKMRDSGHYAERSERSEYHFESWIKDVLPNIKPGAANVHMHNGGGLWPTVDNWTAKDFRVFPKRILDWLMEQLQSSAINGGGARQKNA